MPIRKRPSKKAASGYVFETYFSYKQDGENKRYTKSGFQTLKDAQDHEVFMRAQLYAMEDTHKFKRTIHSVYLEFLAIGSSQYQPNTITNTKRTYQKHIEKPLGDLLINQCNYQTLQAFFNKLDMNGIATNEAVKKALNQIFNFAIKCDYINSNPINLVTIGGEDTSRKDKDSIVKNDDFESVISYLGAKDNFSFKSYIVALYIGKYTGLRVSETFALEKSDINLKDEYIDINKKLIYSGLKVKDLYVSNKTKSKASKAQVPLAKPLKDILIEWFNENPHERVVCDIKGNYLSPSYFATLLGRISKSLNIKFNYHMLRHTFATILVQNRTDIKTTQELLRHSNSNTTINFYVHVTFQHKKDAVNQIFEPITANSVDK